MNHSPEPWKRNIDLNGDIYLWNTEERRQLCLGEITRLLDAERIVACVNACQGVPSEDLEDIIAIAQRELKKCRKLGKRWTNM